MKQEILDNICLVVSVDGKLMCNKRKYEFRPCLSGVHVAQSVVFTQWFVDFVRICSLTIVCLFLFDLRINYYLLLIYDPNKHIGLV